jgi:hypothetical protein
MIDMFGHRPPLKVLSIRQPWASLIMRGHKLIENRKWRTEYRGELFIHAAAKWYDGPEAAPWLEDRDRLPRGVVLGSVELADVITQSDSPWFTGPFGFVLRNPKRLRRPIPLRGQLFIFEVDPSVLAA